MRDRALKRYSSAVRLSRTIKRHTTVGYVEERVPRERYIEYDTYAQTTMAIVAYLV
jgi:hypothetical protein